MPRTTASLTSAKCTLGKWPPIHLPVEPPAAGDAAFLNRSVAFAGFPLGFALDGPDLLLVHGTGIKLGPECHSVCVHITSCQDADLVALLLG